ncbi:hypothetical protein GQX74_012133 [Glossina fuscipes]|nr:hypothetical protein GQX74_012133 [Glossina fuscipes]
MSILSDDTPRQHTRSSSQVLAQMRAIVAAGTPLPSASVMLTTKNLQCMLAILVLAHSNGSILGTSWHIVLQILQHLVWILGLKPSTAGSLQAFPKPAVEANIGIQTAKQHKQGGPNISPKARVIRVMPKLPLAAEEHVEESTELLSYKYEWRK